MSGLAPSTALISGVRLYMSSESTGIRSCAMQYSKSFFLPWKAANTRKEDGREILQRRNSFAESTSPFSAILQNNIKLHRTRSKKRFDCLPINGSLLGDVLNVGLDLTFLGEDFDELGVAETSCDV